MSIFVAIMVPMILTVCNMRFVFGVELQFDAHVLNDLVRANSRGYHLQLQPFPASPFDKVESKETSSRGLAKHLHVPLLFFLFSALYSGTPRSGVFR